jgi:Heterokaryon incompatibility protein (HET)
MATLARNWVNQCTSSHSDCHRNRCQLSCPGGLCPIRADVAHQLPPYLPTRVVDVGYHGSSDPPRLFVPEKGHRADYLTLSYCWGKNGHNARTTRSLVQDMLLCIPWQTLPRSIRDAIIFTRTLGVRYLWVDSLCIIQADDPGATCPDWDLEVSRLGDYYRHSMCTLAVAGSRCSSEGFFYDRPAESYPIREFAISYPNMEQAMISLPEPRWDVSVDECPLIRRGWVTQEIALSTRILYFTRDSVFWECRQHRAAEFQPLPRNDKVRDETEAVLDALLIPKKSSLNWLCQVQAFSGTEFTYPSDKLAAISAMAKEFQRTNAAVFPVGLSYVAGLWLEQLPCGMDWVATGSSSRRPSCRSAAPSWSWASVDSSVIFLAFHGSGKYAIQRPVTYHVEVRDARVQLAGMDSTGRVISGTMIVAGWALRVPIRTYFNQSSDSPYRWYGNEEIPRHLGSENHIAWDVEPNSIVLEQPVLCLLLCSNDETLSTAAMLLQPVSDPALEDFAYTRVGMICAHDGFWSKFEAQRVEDIIMT